MNATKFTIELDIGLSVLLQAALPRLVTDRKTKTIVVDGVAQMPVVTEEPPVMAAEVVGSVRERDLLDAVFGGRGAPVGADRPLERTHGQAMAELTQEHAERNLSDG